MYDVRFRMFGFAILDLIKNYQIVSNKGKKLRIKTNYDYQFRKTFYQ